MGTIMVRNAPDGNGEGWKCRGRESNPHPLRDRILSPAWLPVTPPRHLFCCSLCAANGLSSSLYPAAGESPMPDVEDAISPAAPANVSWYKTLTPYQWF